MSKGLRAFFRSTSHSPDNTKKVDKDNSSSLENPVKIETGWLNSKNTISLDQALPYKEVYLSQIDIFCDLSEDEMHQMVASTTMITCEKGRVFFQPGKVNEVIFLLKKGKVNLYRLSPQGKKFIVATVEQGGIFGEMSLMGQRMSDTYAEAAEDCLICVMSRSDLARLITERPQISLRLLEVIGRRVNRLEHQLEDMAFKNLPARVATLLLDLSKQNRDSPEQVTGLSQQELAEMLGASREMVSLVLSELKKGEVIEIGHKKITVLDREKLMRVAEPGVEPTGEDFNQPGTNQ